MKTNMKYILGSKQTTKISLGKHTDDVHFMDKCVENILHFVWFGKWERKSEWIQNLYY